MAKKYTFKDWFQGLVNIDTEKIDENVGQKPTLLKLSSFSKKDQIKIRIEKRKIFEGFVQKHLLLEKEKFLSDLNEVKDKLHFIDTKIAYHNSLLFGDIPHINVHEGGFHEVENHSEIKHFFFHYVNYSPDNDSKYDFIHSTNSRFKSGMKNQIFAQYSHELILWIYDFKVKIGYEPLNFREDIFVNGYAYNFFYELVSSFENRNGTLKKADMDFILYKLKEDKAIFKFIPQDELLLFLDIAFPTLNFTINDFKGRTDTLKKLEIYARIFPNYEGKF